MPTPKNNIISDAFCYKNIYSQKKVKTNERES